MVEVTSPACFPNLDLSIGTLSTPLSCQYTTADQTLVISNGFQSAVTSKVVVTVRNVRNPPTPYTFSGFSFYIADSSGDAYQRYIGGAGISIQKTTPGVLTSMLLFTLLDPTVSESNEIFVSGKLANPVFNDCTLILGIPDEFLFDGTLIVAKDFISKTPLSYTILSDTEIQVKYSQYVPDDDSIGLLLINIVNPPTTIPTTTGFSLSTYTPDGQPIDQGQTDPYTSIPGEIRQNLSNPIIRLADNFVKSYTKYTFEFVISHPMPGGSMISIIFPESVIIDARDETTACIGPLVGLSVSAKCKVAGQELQVLSGIPNPLNSNTVIRFSVDKVTNPSSTKTTNSFQIRTHPGSSTTYEIDALTAGISVQAAPSPLKEVTVIPDSKITGDVTKYHFSLTIANAIPIGGYIEVIFPDKVLVDDIALAEGTCFPVAFLEGTLDCTATTKSILLENGIVSDALAEDTVIQFEVDHIRNPPSTNKYQSFTVTTFTSNGDEINQSSSGIFVQPDTPNTLSSVSVSPKDLINGFWSEYTFNLQVFNETPNGCKVRIVPPPEVELPTNPVCNPGAATTQIACLELSGYIEASITFQTSPIPAQSSFAFTVQNIKNPGKTRESGSFQIFTFTSGGYAIDKKESGITITTNTPATITDIIISASDSDIAVQTDYTFSYTPINPHPAGTTLQITIPPQFTLGTILCQAVTLDPGMTCSLVSNQLTIENGFVTEIKSPSKITFKIQGITNPNQTTTTNPWTLISKEGAYFIDRSTDQVTNFTCADPCHTCQTTADNCTSCRFDSSTPYFYDNTCHSGCKDGFTDVIATPEKECVACTNDCLTCKERTDKCTSCDINNPKRFLYNDQCNDTCQQGYYGEDTVCKACVNPCLTCRSDTQCQSCTKRNKNPDFGSNTYLYNEECLVQCPIGYLENSTSLLCDKCNSKCLDCSGTINTCSACDPNLKLKDGDCVTTCPSDSRYIDTGPACIRCNPPCDTCQNTVDECRSCLTGLLYGYECIDNCPNGTVAIDQECKTCTGDCQTCTVAVNACTSCKDGKFVYNNQCVVECPTGTVLIGNVCTNCQGCATCQGSTTTCTSCPSGKFLYNNLCEDTCPADIYVPVNRICEPCDPTCKKCSGETNFCTQCHIGKKLYQGTCVLSCPNTTVAIDDVCVACDPACSTCSGTTSTCTSCPLGKLLEGGQCVDSCSGNAIPVGSECKTCNTDCLTCQGTTTTCTSCKTNTYLFNDYCYNECPEGWVPRSGKCEVVVQAECNTGCTELMNNNQSCDPACNVEACAYDNGKCVQGPTICPDGQYLSGTSCLNCKNNCNTCASATQCYSCIDSLIKDSIMLLYEGRCYDTCPSGSYKEGIVCKKCSDSCLTCSGTADTCLSCSLPLLLYNNSCINSCPSDTTVQKGNQCVDCSINCMYCQTDFDKCTECPVDKYLVGTECKSKCPDGYTLVNDTERICYKCDAQCLRCQGTVDNCTACSPNQYLYNSDCLGVCPDGTYRSGSSCKDCSQECVTCSGSKACTSCQSDLVKFSSLCLEQCPAGYLNNNGICEVIPVEADCAPGCTAELLNNPYCDEVCNIVACNSDNQMCAHSGECPPGQFVDGDQCMECNWPCSTCSAPSTCTACSYQVSGDNAGRTMYLYEGACYDQCPQGSLQVGILCEKCKDGCEACAGDSQTCITCPEGFFLYQGSCLAQCPAQVTVQNGIICQDCSNLCETCENDAYNCTSCPAQRFLYQGTCKVECPAGSTLTPDSQTECLLCQGDCQTCKDSVNNCTNCVPPLVLYNNSCFNACPEGITVLKGSKCLPCESPCSECSEDPTLCSSCIEGYALYNRSCFEQCPNGYEARLGLCEPLCAEGCSNELLMNEVCNVVCNFMSCNYDNGLCIPSDCPAGKYRENFDCVDCVYPCNTCYSETYCTSCLVTIDSNRTQLLLNDGVCEVNCSAGTYRDGLLCVKCSENCQSCEITPENCTACPEGLKLHDGQCINTCPDNTTIEISGICEPCNLNCKTCENSVNFCTSCDFGMVLSQGRCTPNCPAGQTTTQTSAGQCVACEGACNNCLGDVNYCTSCKSGYLYQGTCVADCPSGYAVLQSNQTKCSKCSSACKECSNVIDFCTECNDNQELTSQNTCQALPACPDGSTLTNESNGICLPCIEPCVKCIGDVNKCTSCVEGLVLSGNTCIECTSPCKFCEGLPTNCTDCEEGYYLSGTRCQRCDASCNTCQGGSQTCTSCRPGMFLSNQKCLTCNQNCKTCTGTTESCTSCDQGLFLENGQCKSCDPSCKDCQGQPTRCISCPTGQYLSNFTCQPCDSTCADCQGTPTFCTKCPEGKTLINGVCDSCKSGCKECISDFNICSSCPQGKLLIGGNCGDCNANCKTCTVDFDTCGSCQDGKYLKDGECLQCGSQCKTCADNANNCKSCNGTLTLIGNECKQCDPNCKTCSGTVQTCTSCQDPLVLIGNQCLKCIDECKSCSGSVDLCISCPEGSFLQGNSCLYCSDSCLTCEIDSKNCTSCPEGFEMIGNACMIICTPGYFRSGVTCQQCDANCETCSGTSKTCTSCKNGLMYNNVCVKTCPDGYFQLGATCEKCSSNCLQCVESRDRCSTCLQGYKLVGSKCEPICPTGQYLDGGACIDCNPTCRTCNINGCTSCVNPSHVVNSKNQCELPCEEGQTRTSESNGQCIPCSSICRTCSGSTDYCLICKNDSEFLYNGECLEICPIGITVPIGDQCKRCAESCVTCAESTETCTSCVQGQFLYSGQCLQECPEGYEVKTGKCVLCEYADNCPYVPGEGSEEPTPIETGSEDDEEEGFSPEPVTFPFTGFTVLSGIIVSFSKIFATGAQILPSVISIWGIVGAISWLFLGVWLGESEESQERRLVVIQAGDGELVSTMALVLIIVALCFHLLCNLTFIVSFVKQVWRKDEEFQSWQQRHKAFSWILFGMCTLISFHAIRLTYCQLCHLKCFKSSYENRCRVYKPLTRCTYISILCTLVPLIAAQILLIIHYSISNLT